MCEGRGQERKGCERWRRSEENERWSQPRDAWGRPYAGPFIAFSWSVIRVVTSSRYGTIRANLQTPMPPQLWYSVLVMLNSATNETMGLVYFGTFTRPTIRSKSQYSHSPPLDTPRLIHHHFSAQIGEPAPAPTSCFFQRAHSSTQSERGYTLSKVREVVHVPGSQLPIGHLTVRTPRITNQNSSYHAH